ncbi:MAG: hypothetical protein QF767_09135, partial [Alphaproteobacteria bacterium]|nr:hypothetical protein [Alphaproteobacteria bacterium]
AQNHRRPIRRDDPNIRAQNRFLTADEIVRRRQAVFEIAYASLRSFKEQFGFPNALKPVIQLQHLVECEF